MKEYHKIETVFARDMEGTNKNSGNVLQFTLILPIGQKEKICGYWCSYCGLTQDYEHRIVKTEERI